jgi:CHAD domain-containing protein
MMTTTGDGGRAAEVPQEIELKYRVLDAAVAARLLAGDRLGTFAATGTPRTTQHEDRYVDTADGALARAGFAARLRTVGGATVLGIKSLARSGDGALHRRDELEGPADRSLLPRDWPPSDARSLILEQCGDAPLVDIVTLRQLRHKRSYEADGTVLELSLDEVDVVDRGRIVEHFRELEIELVGGEGARLEALATVLDADDRLTAAAGSKYEAALAAAGIDLGDGGPTRRNAAGTSGEAIAVAEPAVAASADAGGRPDAEAGIAVEMAEADAGRPADASPTEVPPPERPRSRRRRPSPPGVMAGAASDAVQVAEPSVESPPPAEVPVELGPPRLAVGKTPGVRRDDTIAEAGRKVLRFHLARMLAREAGTRLGEDPEELHSMRVATRRMRAAWRVFGTAFRPGRTRRYRRDLREVAGRLGAVRDLDVLVEHLDAYAKTRPDPERAGLAPLRAEWLRQREEARVLLLRTLDSPPYERFVAEYRDFVETEGLAVLPVAPTQPHRVNDTMPSHIWAAFEQLRAYEPVMRWADVETLHELRIAAKWLRYTIEFVREPLGPGAGPLVEKVVALQDHLGNLHDADVAAGLARTYLVEHAAGLGDDETTAIARYLIDRERELGRLRRTVGPTWRRVSGIAFRRQLGRVLAEL